MKRIDCQVPEPQMLWFSGLASLSPGVDDRGGVMISALNCADESR